MPCRKKKTATTIKKKDLAKEHNQKWVTVIFNNESKTELYSNEREYIWRWAVARHKPRYTTKTVKFDGESLMVWEDIKKKCCMKADDNKINGIINSQKYKHPMDDQVETMTKHLNIHHVKETRFSLMKT